MAKQKIINGSLQIIAPCATCGQEIKSIAQPWYRPLSPDVVQVQIEERTCSKCGERVTMTQLSGVNAAVFWDWYDSIVGMIPKL